MATTEPEKIVKNPFLLKALATTVGLSLKVDSFDSFPSGTCVDHTNAVSPSATAINRELLSSEKSLNSALAHLHGQNRKLAHLARDSKAKTGESRADVDRLHLELQNLQYEHKHLQSEIAACEEHEHPHTELPLVEEDDFLHKFPEWLEKRTWSYDQTADDATLAEKDATKTIDALDAPKEAEKPKEAKQPDDYIVNFGEAGFMKARIQDERSAREELHREKQVLMERKGSLVKTNAERKGTLIQLDKDLDKFVNVSVKCSENLDRMEKDLDKMEKDLDRMKEEAFGSTLIPPTPPPISPAVKHIESASHRRKTKGDTDSDDQAAEPILNTFGTEF